MNALILRVLAFVLAACVASLGQNPESGSATSEGRLADAVQQLQEQIVKLQASVAELRTESERYREQTQELERQLEAFKESKTTSPEVSSAPTSEVPEQIAGGGNASSTTGRLSKLEDEFALLTGKVDDQYQTKVESGSKYPVRLSGLVMLNLFSNRGVPYSIDSPGPVIPNGSFLGQMFGGGSFAGTLRQSQVGIQVFGPEWAGAKVTGDLRFDFAGGFPDADNGVTMGLMRLRTGTVRLDWSHTSLIAGQDAPMFSPLSPTSVIALAQPEFSYAGNLWTWVPQIQVQHWLSLGSSQRLNLSAGILDPLTGEPPPLQFQRFAQAGEAGRQPGYAARIGWSDLRNEDRPTTFSVGGYFSHENWGFNRQIDGWATTADWKIPILRRFAVQGEVYRGNAIGGFGASGDQSVLSSNSLQNPLASVRGLDDVGGWTQASFQASPVLEFNAGLGIDNPFTSELRSFASIQNLSNPELALNRSAMANVIYRPRSDLLFSIEYRHFSSWRTTSQAASAENLGMGIGVLF